MFTKTQQSNPTSKNYQDYNNGYVPEDTAADEYYGDDFGSVDMVPVDGDEFIMGQGAGQGPIDIDGARVELRRVLQLAMDKGANSAVLDAIQEIAGQVNYSASLPADQQAQVLTQAMADLSNAEIGILSGREGVPAEGEAEQNNIKELEGKIQELQAKIEDPAMFKYAVERSDLREKLEKAKASLDLGDVETAEMMVTEVDSAIESREAENKSSAFEDLTQIESTIETVQDYLKSKVRGKNGEEGRESTAKLETVLKRLRDGEITPEDAESEAKRIVQVLEGKLVAKGIAAAAHVKYDGLDADLSARMKYTDPSLLTQFTGLWEKATGTELV